MIASEKSHQNLSDYIQFLLKKRYSIEKRIIYSKRMRNSGNYNYDYANSFFVEDF